MLISYILCDLFRNIYRIGFATSAPIVKALKYVCDQVLVLARRLEKMPLDVSLLEGFIKRMEDFNKQLLSIKCESE